MTRQFGRLGVFSGSLLSAAAFAAAGCETSSHKSVNTYEYDGAPRSEEREDRPSARLQADQPAEAEDGEWHMVAPGEMTSPGKPVVDPSRKNP